ncbi:MAG: TorF family putative porin, partial [Pseudomonadota bacterium]
MNILAPYCAAALLAFSLPALAEESAKTCDVGEFTGNVALVSDYTFRGVSQSKEEPTIQGGFDWAQASTGLYLGVWGSGVDFTDATTEIDLYGGIGGSMNKFSWKLGGIYYYYPGAAGNLNYDFWEAAAVFGYDFGVVQTNLALNYSPNYFTDSGSAFYTSLNATAPLPHDFRIDAHVGRQVVDDNAAFGYKYYNDWSLGVGYKIS